VTEADFLAAMEIRAGNAGNGEPEQPGFWTTPRRIGAAIVGLAAIVTAVAAILALHPKL
jgi:hypothetical protein